MSETNDKPDVAPQEGQQGQQEQEQAPVSEDIKALIAALSQKPAETTPEPGAETATPSATDEVSALGAAYADPATAPMVRVFKAAAPGLDLERAVGKAVAHGDLSLIDEAYIKEKGGKGAQDLLSIAQALVEQVNHSAVALQDEVYATAGGEENWDASVAVFNKEAPAHLRTVVKKMADSPDRSAVLAAAQYVIEFGAQHGVTTTKGNQMRGNPSETGAGNALDKKTFQQELLKLNPNSRDYADQYNQLIQRRSVGKRLGR